MSTLSEAHRGQGHTVARQPASSLQSTPHQRTNSKRLLLLPSLGVHTLNFQHQCLFFLITGEFVGEGQRKLHILLSSLSSSPPICLHAFPSCQTLPPNLTTQSHACICCKQASLSGRAGLPRLPPSSSPRPMTSPPFVASSNAHFQQLDIGAIR